MLGCMTMGRRRFMLGIGAAYGQAIYVGGFVSTAIGAGLIGFAVLRPTNRKDE